MRRSIPLFLLLTAIPALGQTSQSCPVGIFATRQAGGNVMSVTSTQPEASSQGLHITLTPNQSPIESAEITLYALTLKQRILPIHPADQAPDTISKTFELHTKPNQPGLTNFDLWMSKVSALQHVELRSLTYADGTTWHASATEPCRTTPSNYVLVTSR
jgi:hypothetical protein